MANEIGFIEELGMTGMLASARFYSHSKSLKDMDQLHRFLRYFEFLGFSLGSLQKASIFNCV